MNMYSIPVVWEMSGRVIIEAESPEEALQIFNETQDDLPLPAESYYVDDSFQLAFDAEELIDTLKPFNQH